jgi:branched-chain amino acid transport system permease protein
MSTYLPYIILGLALGGAYGLQGVGMVVLYKATGVLNLAYGAIGAIGALIADSLINDVHAGRAVGYLVAILFGGVLLLLYGLSFGRWLAARDPLVKAVATIGVMLGLLGLMALLWTSQAYALPLPTDNWSFTVSTAVITGTQVLTFGLRLSRLGIAMRSLANNREATAVLGVPVARVEASAWFVAGLIAGVTGLLLADQVGLDASTLTMLVVSSVAAALVAGLSSLWVTLLAGLAIGVTQSVVTSVQSLTSYQALTPFVFAVIALLWYGRRRAVAGGTLRPPATVVEIPVGQTQPGDQTFWQRRLGRTIYWAVVLVVAFAVAPQVLSLYWVQSLTVTAVYAVIALGLGTLVGRVGLVSLGSIALVAIAGWVALRLSFAMALPFGVTVLITGLITAVVGVLIGLPSLRLQGLYLALITLMAAAGVTIVLQVVNFPNGGSGFWGYNAAGAAAVQLPRPQIAGSDLAYYRLVVVVAGLMFVLTALHLRSRAGRAWQAIRQSEVSALATGINVALYKVWALALASFVIGVGGALLAASRGGITMFQFPTANNLTMLAIVLIAGTYTLPGAVAAGIMMQLMSAVFTVWGISNNFLTAFFGVGVLQILTMIPHGVSVQLPKDLRNLGRRLVRLGTWAVRLVSPKQPQAVSAGGPGVPMELPELLQDNTREMAHDDHH